MTNNHIILFDGVCNLCNGFVQFVIKRDKKNIFQFASLQSDAGKELIQPYSISSNLESFIYLRNGKVFQQSTAALLVLKDLSFPFAVVYVFIIVPAFIRNAVYKFMAKRRYKWFGKREKCLIPQPQYKHKFLD